MEGKLTIKIILIIFLATSFLTFPISYARYNFYNDGNYNVDIAKWDIVLNDKSLDEEHVFDLFKTVNNDNINKNIKALAPGTKGSITFNIINNSDVFSECTIEVEETENTYDIPILYSLDENGEYKELKELEIANNLELGIKENKTITLYWQWPFYKDSLQNQKDNELASNETAKLLITTNVKVKQKIN